MPNSEFCVADRGQYYKTVNIYRFSARFSRDHLVPHLGRYVVEHGSGAFYEQVLEALLVMSEVHLAALDIGGRRWYEIDDAQDLDIAETLFAPDDERPRRLASRFGGYWRFPHLIDFAYLGQSALSSAATARGDRRATFRGWRETTPRDSVCNAI